MSLIASSLAVLLAASCMERPLPTATNRPLTAAALPSLTLSLSLRQFGEARTLQIIAGYARTTALTNVIPMDTARVSFAPSDNVVPVRLNVAGCLADPARELPPGVSADQAQKACVLRLTITVLDDTGQPIDRAVPDPLPAYLGEPAVIPDIALGVRSPSEALTTSAGGTCVLSDLGAAYCWGFNSSGELGTGDNIQSLIPRPVAGGLTFRQIAMGGLSTCGLSATGVAYCWGQNTFGQLGNGSTALSVVPSRVGGNVRFESIGVGFGFACGVALSSHDGYCWGRNDVGQLGTGDTVTRNMPTLVSGGLKFSEISAGFRHTCARVLSSATPLFCWGLNANRQLGVTSTASPVSTPTPVSTPQNLTFISVRAMELYSCGLAADSTAYCWGTDRFGEMGIGAVASGAKPTPTLVVAPGVRFAGITGGKSNDTFSGSCAWTSAGAGYCWGANRSGQLGTTVGTSPCATAVSCAGAPTRVEGSAQFVAISQGGDHACGLTSTHVVLCWGSNAGGMLGNGTTTDSPTPTPATGAPRTP